MKNSEKPAFPITEEATDRIDAGVKIYTGLSKREYFAGLAMQGILAGIPQRHQDMIPLLKYYSSQYPDKTMNECVALEAIALADELLKQLEK